MRILKTLFSRKTVPKWVVASFGVISFLGFIDASYLTIEHYRGQIPPCTIVEGCGTVITSSYSVVMSVPVALLGALYYLTLLTLTIGYLDSKRPRFMILAIVLTPIGFIASLYFLLLQIFVLKAFCIYCLGSIATSTALFIIGLEQQHKKYLQ